MYDVPDAELGAGMLSLLLWGAPLSWGSAVLCGALALGVLLWVAPTLLAGRVALLNGLSAVRACTGSCWPRWCASRWGGALAGADVDIRAAPPPPHPALEGRMFAQEQSIMALKKAVERVVARLGAGGAEAHSEHAAVSGAVAHVGQGAVLGDGADAQLPLGCVGVGDIVDGEAAVSGRKEGFVPPPPPQAAPVTYITGPGNPNSPGGDEEFGEDVSAFPPRQGGSAAAQFAAAAAQDASAFDDGAGRAFPHSWRRAAERGASAVGGRSPWGPPAQGAPSPRQWAGGMGATSGMSFTQSASARGEEKSHKMLNSAYDYLMRTLGVDPQSPYGLFAHWRTPPPTAQIPKPTLAVQRAAVDKLHVLTLKRMHHHKRKEYLAYVHQAVATWLGAALEIVKACPVSSMAGHLHGRIDPGALPMLSILDSRLFGNFLPGSSEPPAYMKRVLEDMRISPIAWKVSAGCVYDMALLWALRAFLSSAEVDADERPLHTRVIAALSSSDNRPWSPIMPGASVDDTISELVEMFTNDKLEDLARSVSVNSLPAGGGWAMQLMMPQLQALDKPLVIGTDLAVPLLGVFAAFQENQETALECLSPRQLAAALWTLADEAPRQELERFMMNPALAGWTESRSRKGTGRSSPRDGAGGRSVSVSSHASAHGSHAPAGARTGSSPTITAHANGCFRCGQPGHRVAECTQPETLTCHNCNQVGHKQRNCPQARQAGRSGSGERQRTVSARQGSRSGSAEQRRTASPASSRSSNTDAQRGAHTRSGAGGRGARRSTTPTARPATKP